MKLEALAQGQIVQAQRYAPQWGGMFTARVRRNADNSYDLQFHIGAEEKHITYYTQKYDALDDLKDRLKHGYFYTSKGHVFDDLPDSNAWRSHAVWRKYKTAYVQNLSCKAKR